MKIKKKIQMDELILDEVDVMDEVDPEEDTCIQPCTLVDISPCDTCKKIDLCPSDPTNPGVLITVTSTINNLCPNKLLSVAAVLCERVGDQDIVRAVQVKEIKTPSTTPCASLNVQFDFAFPQMCGGNNRKFKAKIVAHYVNPTGCTCPCSM
ncbi:hypothetical protein DP145_03025 [Clostridium tetani]|uniref:hypothetical protein n=1 Tax=Clostridium tetani TaxID=1513 RepID=UPI00100BD529|nr:hypothetical protein [Clostridium tetani]RXI47770.1 hypothetical protein DP126_00470 [Clostridium tetani]RXM61152.1 hypothetical protein DP138_05955 [Clostridium tetani]RXM69678.1 hypothetical protein DP145_03025 [Clostridium tetani]